MMPQGWAAFAIESSLKDFAWGEWDCMLEPGEWLLRSTGIDLISKYRDAYASADECRALFRSRGGIARALKKEAAEAGLAETAEPQGGDIGIVRAFPLLIGGRRQALFPMGAVMMQSGRWRVRMFDGHVTGQFPPIAAWSLKCRR